MATPPPEHHGSSSSSSLPDLLSSSFFGRSPPPPQRRRLIVDLNPEKKGPPGGIAGTLDLKSGLACASSSFVAKESGGGDSGFGNSSFSLDGGDGAMAAEARAVGGAYADELDREGKERMDRSSFSAIILNSSLFSPLAVGSVDGIGRNRTDGINGDGSDGNNCNGIGGSGIDGIDGNGTEGIDGNGIDGIQTRQFGVVRGGGDDGSLPMEKTALGKEAAGDREKFGSLLDLGGIFDTSLSDRFTKPNSKDPSSQNPTNTLSENPQIADLLSLQNPNETRIRRRQRRRASPNNQEISPSKLLPSESLRTELLSSEPLSSELLSSEPLSNELLPSESPPLLWTGTLKYDDSLAFHAIANCLGDLSLESRLRELPRVLTVRELVDIKVFLDTFQKGIASELVVQFKLPEGAPPEDAKCFGTMAEKLSGVSESIRKEERLQLELGQRSFSVGTYFAAVISSLQADDAEILGPEFYIVAPSVLEHVVEYWLPPTSIIKREVDFHDCSKLYGFFLPSERASGNPWKNNPVMPSLFLGGEGDGILNLVSRPGEDHDKPSSETDLLSGFNKLGQASDGEKEDITMYSTPPIDAGLAKKQRYDELVPLLSKLPNKTSSVAIEGESEKDGLMDMCIDGTKDGNANRRKMSDNGIGKTALGLATLRDGDMVELEPRLDSLLSFHSFEPQIEKDKVKRESKKREREDKNNSVCKVKPLREVGPGCELEINLGSNDVHEVVKEVTELELVATESGLKTGKGVVGERAQFSADSGAMVSLERLKQLEDTGVLAAETEPLRNVGSKVFSSMDLLCDMPLLKVEGKEIYCEFYMNGLDRESRAWVLSKQSELYLQENYGVSMIPRGGKSVSGSKLEGQQGPVHVRISTTVSESSEVAEAKWFVSQAAYILRAATVRGVYAKCIWYNGPVQLKPGDGAPPVAAVVRKIKGEDGKNLERIESMTGILIGVVLRKAVVTGDFAAAVSRVIGLRLKCVVRKGLSEASKQAEALLLCVANHFSKADNSLSSLSRSRKGFTTAAASNLGLPGDDGAADAAAAAAARKAGGGSSADRNNAADDVVVIVERGERLGYSSGGSDDVDDRWPSDGDGEADNNKPKPLFLTELMRNASAQTVKQLFEDIIRKYVCPSLESPTSGRQLVLDVRYVPSRGCAFVDLATPELVEFMLDLHCKRPEVFHNMKMELGRRQALLPSADEESADRRAWVVPHKPSHSGSRPDRRGSHEWQAERRSDASLRDFENADDSERGVGGGGGDTWLRKHRSDPEKTIYADRLPDNSSESLIRRAFEHALLQHTTREHRDAFGEGIIQEVRHIPSKYCAFVVFASEELTRLVLQLYNQDEDVFDGMRLKPHFHSRMEDLYREELLDREVDTHSNSPRGSRGDRCERDGSSPKLRRADCRGGSAAHRAVAATAFKEVDRRRSVYVDRIPEDVSESLMRDTFEKAFRHARYGNSSRDSSRRAVSQVTFFRDKFDSKKLCAFVEVRSEGATQILLDHYIADEDAFLGMRVRSAFKYN